MRHAFRHFFAHHHADGHGRRGWHHGRGRGFGQRLEGEFFGREGGGGGMRAVKMLAAGDLRLVILALLKDKPLYGFEIIKALEEHTSGVYAPSPGMVYPALTYLEEVGHAQCAPEGKKKLFSLTAEGDAHLTEHRAEADETLDALKRYGDRLAQFQKQMSAEEETTEQFGRGQSGRIQEWRALKQEFKQIKSELRQAIFEKIDAPMAEKQRILQVLREAIASIRGK